ncbi:MAG TPA: hypothetical protein VG734_04655 [Lacunisphaera sp.]|nr:hypothetical protein [Lacunisphaera sp.]
MASTTFKIIAGTVTVVALGVGVVALHLDNARLRPRIDRLKSQRAEAERLRADNRELQAIISGSGTGTAAGVPAIRADLPRARVEVQELERKAREDYIQTQAIAARDAQNLAANRDPERGLVRLEYFENKGRATPAGAFQTFVWAAMRGEDGVLADMITLDDQARARGMVMLAGLSDEVRAKYPTPEKLAALFFADALTAQPSAEVLEVSFPDARNAVVRVRGLADQPQKIPMQYGPSGWQIVVPSGMVEKLGGWVKGGMAAPRK